MSSPGVMVEHTDRALLLVPLLPLFGSVLSYLVGGWQLAPEERHRRHASTGWIATAFSFASFFVAVKLFLELSPDTEAVSVYMWQWFEVSSLQVDFALRLDRLASVMSLVVTGVGSLIHLYAIGYMAHDDDRPRFFSYLNLFLFAMLVLVLGDNLLMMFVGWEGVGLCSYLLIGFWFKEMPNASAGQKAFVVNRIGDAGFLLGIFSLYLLTDTINFSELQANIGSLPVLAIEIIAILLFIGAVGKSAQIPLFVWLPDAMAGPTPVSALIHAATMVTAGVYMIARMGFLYELAPVALTVITVVGTLTALIAATIAIAQNDIKKVLAYSTVSQLGYMFMAMGAGAFSNGIYHVVTHAFFKACLFMAAGSVIVGCHHVQDMRQFGGLRKSMPWTFVTYLIATLAIAGFPFMSGFFSKDAILWTVFSNTGLPAAVDVFGVQLNHWCWGIGLFTALLTAFYMTRSLMMTFFGQYRGHHPPHESPWVVTLPLVVLAALSAGFAFFHGEALMHYLAAWTREDMKVGHEVLAQNHTYHLLEWLSIGVALLGILVGYLFYGPMREMPRRIVSALPGLHKALWNKWWVDEIYDRIVIGPLSAASSVLFVLIDRLVIDQGLVEGSGMFVEANGEVLRRAHTGQIRNYALLMFLGTFILITCYLVFHAAL